MNNPDGDRHWSSDDVAETFLSFFRKRGHLQAPSSSLVPENDPTVLLTTAGVQQFVPFLLGKQAPPSRRLCSLQKCFRTTDIGSVGDMSHNTFFEMLGNWSVGDYLKTEMIPWAFELVTEEFRLPKERIWVTVHPTDDEARQLWQEAGLDPAHILVDETNFWGPPGASGPCGPDTELYYDWGPEACGTHACCTSGQCFPSCECNRFLEFWNLVFMEHFQDEQGGRTPLAQKNIDTGSGLERITRILQGVPSAYETDLFLPIIQRIEALTGVRYGAAEHTDQVLRVLADHGRAMTFVAGDGVSPGNEGRGYVLRRIIRRAVRFGRRLGVEGPFLEHVVDAVVDRMSARYPTLGATRDHIKVVIGGEEQRFLTTLQAGLSLLDQWIEIAKNAGEKEISGDQVFRLYDTYGFPRELSEEILAEAGLAVPEGEYEQALAAQRERSRNAARFAVSRGADDRADVSSQPPTIFCGYGSMAWGSPILAVDAHGDGESSLTEGQSGTVILAETPFYAEGGGQVGDTGEIVTARGAFLVEDTQRDGSGHFLHLGRVIQGEIVPGDIADARVDVERRRDIMRHHSVTHLLHKSLHLTLGPKTVQAGSLVSPAVARFDFPHDGPLSTAQLEQLEDLMNREILADLTVDVRELPFREALDEGAAAFFGEKYGDRVRVVTMGDFSKELCGGTHVSSTGELGAAYIASETGIGSGIRRVEVVAGRAAHELARSRSRQVAAVSARLGVPPDQLEERVLGLLDELKEVRRVTSRLEATLGKTQAETLVAAAQDVGAVRLVAGRVEATSMDGLLQVKDFVQQALGSGIVVLGAVLDGHPQFVVGISPELVSPRLDAVKLIKEVAAVAGGGGGGRPELARAGGRDASKLEAALSTAHEVVRVALGG